MNTVTRTPFQGVGQSIRFNWTKYATAMPICAALCALPSLIGLGGPAALACWILGGAAGWWAIASIVAAYWAFDRSGVYQLTWLARTGVHAPSRWVNVHAGLDEFSSLLEERFGHAPAAVLDIYDPVKMTEHAIVRARGVYPPHRMNIPAKHDALPRESGSCDAIFTLFAAHELRSHADRVALLSEFRRCMAPNGVGVVLEFPRDAANFIAFGPGFLHFFSRAAWRRAFRDAGLRITTEEGISPLVRMFVLEAAPVESTR